MACNRCEIEFQGSQSLVISIVKSGTSALLYVQNQGRNILHIRRIFLSYYSVLPSGGGKSVALRPPPDPVSWDYPSAFLEPGILSLFYVWNNIPANVIVQAQGDYIEIDGRSRSCPTNF